MGKKYRGISDETGEKLEELYEETKIKQKLKLGSFKKPQPKTFKEWFNQTVLSTFFLIGCLSIIWLLVRQDLWLSFVIECLLAYPIVYFMLTVHESLHAFAAKRLGYKFDFTHDAGKKKKNPAINVYHKDDSKWAKDRLTILFLPYLIILPISLPLAIQGFYLGNWALILGFGSTFVHQSFWMYFDYKGANESKSVTS